MDSPEPDAPQPEPAPTQIRTKNAVRNVGAGVVGLGLVVAKYVLIFGKVFALSWTFLLSLGLYVMAFGWRFAIVIILTLLVHELGHYFAFRSYGLPARLPQFVPFLGAYTMGAPSPDPEHNAYIALAGPLTGLAVASLCYAVGDLFHDSFWIAVAAFSAMLNLFNLIPVPPFDGGRVGAVIWHPSSGMPARVRVGLSYVGTALGLLIVMLEAHGR